MIRRSLLAAVAWAAATAAAGAAADPSAAVRAEARALGGKMATLPEKSRETASAADSRRSFESEWDEAERRLRESPTASRAGRR